MLRSRARTARSLAFAIGAVLTVALDGCASAPPDRTAPSPAPRPDSVRRDTGMVSTIANRAVDIARIEVLKDVASTSIHGVRGANGVIAITTKK